MRQTVTVAAAAMTSSAQAAETKPVAAGVPTGKTVEKTAIATAKARMPVNMTGRHLCSAITEEGDSAMLFLPGQRARYSPSGFFAVNC
jgi:hypothetical protein